MLKKRTPLRDEAHWELKMLKPLRVQFWMLRCQKCARPSKTPQPRSTFGR